MPFLLGGPLMGGVLSARPQVLGAMQHALVLSSHIEDHIRESWSRQAYLVASL